MLTILKEAPESVLAISPFVVNAYTVFASPTILFSSVIVGEVKVVQSPVGVDHVAPWSVEYLMKSVPAAITLSGLSLSGILTVIPAPAGTPAGVMSVNVAQSLSVFKTPFPTAYCTIAIVHKYMNYLISLSSFVSPLPSSYSSASTSLLSS